MTEAVERMLVKADIAFWACDDRWPEMMRAALATIAPLEQLAALAEGSLVCVPREAVSAAQQAIRAHQDVRPLRDGEIALLDVLYAAIASRPGAPEAGDAER